MKKRMTALLTALLLAITCLGVVAHAEEKVLTFGCQMYSDGLVNPAAQINCAWR